MANFDDRVMGLTGLTVSGSSSAPSQAELTTFLTDGAREIINILPPSLLEYCTKYIELADATPMPIASDTDIGKILFVTRDSADSSGFYQACRKIPAAFSGLVTDSSNLKYFASETDPVFWIVSDGGGNTNLYVKPNTTSNQKAQVHHVSFPEVAYNHSSIDNFHDGAEYLVVLYASMKSLLAAIGSITIPPTVGGVSESLTSSMAAIDSDQLGLDDDFNDFNKWFVALGEMIEDDEDIELASAQIEKINSYVNTWNIQLQGNLAEMQQYMQLYQTLKADYTMGIQMLVSGGLPQAQPQQARR